MTTSGPEDPLITRDVETPAEGAARVAVSQEPILPGNGRPLTPASRVARPLGKEANTALRTLATLAIIAALVLARAVLVPVALAALIAFLLSPIARAIEKLRVPRAIAATLCVLGLAVGMLGVLWVSGKQAVDLANRLPEYQKTLNAKFGFLRTGGFASPVLEASERLKKLGGTITAGPDPTTEPTPETDPTDPKPAASAPPTPPPPAPVDHAVPVRIVPEPQAPLAVFGELLGSVLGPLGDFAVIILLAIFLMTYRVDVRERLLALGSAPRLGVTSQALEEAGKRVAKYLLSNLAVNVLYGTAVGIAVGLIGVPNAPLWGLLCALLRFIPYIGTWIGAALPLAVSIAVFDSWGPTGAVFLAILVIDVIVGNVIEPVVYGHRTGLSPLAVVIATVFWTWVWGIPGLLLAIPMTLCLAVVGRYVPGFGIFHVLLGDEPVLDPAERAYERLLAFDAAGAMRVLGEQKSAGVTAAAEAVLLGALRRAERDRREGHIDEERYLAICDGVREAIEAIEAVAPAAASIGTILCLPAFGETDRVACELLAKELEAVGITVTIGPNATTTSEAVPLAVRSGVLAVCVVALPPFAGLRVRYGVRRARSQEKEVRLLGIVLDPAAERPRIIASLRQAGATDVTFTLADTIATVLPAKPVVDPPSRLDGPIAKPDAPASPLGDAVKTRG